MHVRYFTPFVSGTRMIAIVVWPSSVVGSTFSHLMPQLCTKPEKQPLGWFDTEFTSKSKVYASKKKRKKNVESCCCCCCCCLTLTLVKTLESVVTHVPTSNPPKHNAHQVRGPYRFFDNMVDIVFNLYIP